jgi:hypothetical protein
VTRFWWRSRDWPLVGQLGFALLVIVVAGIAVGGISNALHGDGGTGQATTGLVASPRNPTTTRVSPTSALVSSTTTALPPITSPATSRLVALTISPQSHASSYDRLSEFGGFKDQNGCEDTRAVLLIHESRAPVTFTEATDCTVKSGRWTDPWSGVTTTVAHDLDIDHTVPLDNAWVSGAWAWSHDQRVAYANDLTDTDQLVPILVSENRSKGDRGPDAWKPPLASSWCRYALDWDHIKAKWHLTATTTEWAALTQMAGTC